MLIEKPGFAYDPVIIILLCFLAAAGNLLPSAGFESCTFLNLLEGNFAIGPSMRQDCIGWDISPKELMELKCDGM